MGSEQKKESGMNQLKVWTACSSDKGRKALNQDACGSRVPDEPLLSTKGVALALADGISSSEVSQEASQTAVMGFLSDYYDTPEPWSTERSGRSVIQALNAWLDGQTSRSDYRFNRDTGYVCTFEGVVLKGKTAYIFHVGDARLYHIRQDAITQLTEDHRKYLSPEKSVLSRALGVDDSVKIDFSTVAYASGDIFLITTDGVHEFVSPEQMVEIVH